MKTCPKCGSVLEDAVVFCPTCGVQFAVPPTDGQNPPPAYPYTQPAVDPADHTAEFSAEDAAENKPYALLIYLTGIIGIVVALLANRESPYLKFHIKQMLTLTILAALSGLAMAVLFWTIIVPIVGSIWMVFLLVIQLIGFFTVCGNKSKELPIIRSFTFLK